MFMKNPCASLNLHLSTLPTPHNNSPTPTQHPFTVYLLWLPPYHILWLRTGDALPPSFSSTARWPCLDYHPLIIRPAHGRPWWAGTPLHSTRTSGLLKPFLWCVPQPLLRGAMVIHLFLYFMFFFTELTLNVAFLSPTLPCPRITCRDRQPA